MVRGSSFPRRREPRASGFESRRNALGPRLRGDDESSRKSAKSQEKGRLRALVGSAAARRSPQLLVTAAQLLPCEPPLLPLLPPPACEPLLLLPDCAALRRLALRAMPPLRPASRASSEVNSCAVPF